MSACPACRGLLPDGARFCPSCGTRLDASLQEATERKVVTTLFADLVGFTALGERYDPEDVDVALRAYYGLARQVIERFGGIVEKFIGDAVVGLFGIPLVHEDDAERAVRAALEIVARMGELQAISGERLQVRCAVNTGPALVRLHARPEVGEGVLVGDATNTAARLLAATPPMTVAAGAATYDLTHRAIDYAPLATLTAKGKAKRIARWKAVRAVARRGIDPSRRDVTPMIGREVAARRPGGPPRPRRRLRFAAVRSRHRRSGDREVKTHPRVLPARGRTVGCLVQLAAGWLPILTGRAWPTGRCRRS